MPGVDIKKDDNVRVISGKDRGREGRVVRVLPEEGTRDGGRRRAGQEAPALERQAARGSSQQLQQGGIIDVEMFVNISNVQLVCSACGKPTRIGHRTRGTGRFGSAASARRRCHEWPRRTTTCPASRARYREELVPALKRPARADQHDAGAAPREDRRQHGRRRRRQGRPYAGRGGGGPGDDHRPEAGRSRRRASRSRRSSSARACAIGAKVTLRGDRMWEFFDRLVSIALPRIRDFRGSQPDGRSTDTATTRSA